MAAAVRFVSQMPDRWPLTVVIEGGHRNCPDAVRIFNEIKEKYISHDIDVLGPIAVELKKKCLPLASADALAHALFQTRGAGDIVIPGNKRTPNTTINQSVPLELSSRLRIQNFILTRDHLATATDLLLAP
jgi:hypothetical protein